MALGLPILPSSTMAWLRPMACVMILVVGLTQSPVNARPKNTDTPTSDDLTEEWKEAADWMASDDVQDSSDTWRAFPRSNVDQSPSRWWEGKLDDKLWDANSYASQEDEEEEEVESSNGDDYNSSVEEVEQDEEEDEGEEEEEDRSDELSTDSDENKTGENGADPALPTISNDNDDDDDDSDDDDDTSSESNEFSTSKDDDEEEDDVDDDDIESDFVPAGGLNSFVDQKSLSSYFGDDFNKKTWSPGTVIDDVIDEDADETKEEVDDDTDDFRNDIKEGGDPSNIINNEVSDEVQILDETASDDVLGTEEDEDINEKKNNDNSDLQSEVKVLDDVGITMEEVVPDTGDNDKRDNDDGVIDSLKDVDFIIPGIDKRSSNSHYEEKKTTSTTDAKDKDNKDDEDDVFLSSDAVKLDFGRGEKLEGSKDSLQNWNQADAADKKKGPRDEEFEDWADWDDSAFDDYDGKDDKDSKDTTDYDDDDDSDDNDDDDEDEDDSADDVSDDNDDDYSDESDDDDDDDYESDEDESDEDEDDYDDDDDDDDDIDDDDNDDEEDDEDNEEDSDESDYYSDGEETVENDTGMKPRTFGQLLPLRALHSSAQEAVKDEDIESLDTSDAVDGPHYNKGVIFDSSHPFKKSKPSVKKDLGAHKISSNPFAAPNNKDAQLNNLDTPLGRKIEAAKLSKKNSVNAQQSQQSEERMSTGLESLTSPNPAPTVTTWIDTSLPSLSPSPLPSSLPPSPSPSPISSSSSPASSSPWPSDVDNMMFGDQPMQEEEDDEEEDDNESDEVEKEEKYVDSYPLELCRLDYECRSGRTCVEGVCKCFKAAFCAGHYKPVCGSDGVEYPSHCELHRSSCINRMRIRVDRSGLCFKNAMKNEKSWLMEQERLLQEDKEKLKARHDENSVHIPKDEIKEIPNYIYNGDALSTTTIPGPEESEEVDQMESSSPNDEKKQQVNSKCTWNEMANFKEALLMYHCHKFIEPNCKLEVKTDRQYLSILMFSYYDRNFDFFLTADELLDKERDEHFSSNIIKNCHLADFVRFADKDSVDEKLTVSEFTQSYVLPKPSSAIPSNFEVVSTLASAGDGLELKCGVEAKEVIWKRYGVQIKDDKKNHKLMVFEDGALFFSKLSLHHIGNYTCIDTMDEKNAQVHRLNIQTSPILEVSPATQNDIAGSDVEMRCHAEGVPKPTVTWRHNGKDVLNSKHVSVYSGREHIVVHNAQPQKDSGKYICRAHSQAGTIEQAITVKIHPPAAYPSSVMQNNEGTFLIFHESGITVFDPMTCLTRHKVHGDFGDFKFIPDAMDSPLTLCRAHNKSCHWSDAVKVGSEFVYVSQPDQNRVLIVEAGHFWNPLQVIDTDHRPEKLQYVPHLDQVWVLCHSQSGAKSDKTVVVIRDASQHIQHRSVHTRPVGNHFDTVEDLFIAPPNDLRHELDHGYVTHTGMSSLSKINLEDMSYTESIDLSVYGCMPVHVAFVPLGGHVVIQCVSKSDGSTLQLVMDYLTSAIVTATSIPGKPLVSPDSRHMITVDDFSGKVVVASVSVEGVMETTYEVTVSARISDVSFIPSTYHHGYDLILTSADDDDLIVMNLVTGKVEKMPGSNQPESSQAWQTSPIHRRIVAGDPMSKYVMTPSRSSLSVINFKFKHVECEMTDLAGDNKVMVHISSPRLTS